MKQNVQSIVAGGALVLLLAGGAFALEELGGAFDGSPDDASIVYSGPADDAIARLNRKLEDGSVQLAYDPVQGSYLRSVLDALRVPVESQIVAMARTSVQQRIIHPDNPRTLYFNDLVIVGYVRGGFIEAAAQDPKQGMMFYTLAGNGQARFQRENDCLSCHLAYDTMGVPGTLLRSVFPQPDGSVLPGTGRYATDHRSPVEQRYGGWYVTGKRGPARDLGNLFFTDPDKAEAPAKAQLLATLAGKLDPARYLSSYSDIVALQVFDHQMHMMNLLTRVGWEARWAKAQQPSTLAERMKNAATELVDYLLFVDEAPFEGKIEGSSGFAEKFAAEGPFDSRGRSLRQFDLEHRLMRYPCSYMIYSEAFDNLPPAAKDAIYRRLWAVLSGRVSGGKYARLSPEDRKAVLQILRETKKDLPAYFAG